MLGHVAGNVIRDLMQLHTSVREGCQERVPLVSQRLGEPFRPPPHAPVVPLPGPPSLAVLLHDSDLERDLRELNLKEAVVVNHDLLIDEPEHEFLRCDVVILCTHERLDDKGRVQRNFRRDKERRVLE